MICERSLIARDLQSFSQSLRYIRVLQIFPNQVLYEIQSKPRNSSPLNTPQTKNNTNFSRKIKKRRRKVQILKRLFKITENKCFFHFEWKLIFLLFFFFLLLLKNYEEKWFVKIYINLLVYCQICFNCWGVDGWEFFETWDLGDPRRIFALDFLLFEFWMNSLFMLELAGYNLTPNTRNFSNLSAKSH